MANVAPEFFIETIHPYFKGPEPLFFEKTNYPWAVELEKNTSNLIKSIGPLLDDDNDFKSTLGRIKAELPDNKKTWQGYYFYFNGIKVKKHLDAYPEVATELAKIPNLVTANIAILEPNSRILPHRGTTNGFLRCHLGLKIPAPLPECGFIVGDEQVSWEDGKLWIFGDMNIHVAFNNTQKRRYIMMLDVVKPEFLRYKKLLCVHQLSKYYKSVTGDFIRDLFHVPPPYLESDPYKPGVDRSKVRAQERRETRGQKISRKMEDILFIMYKPLFWVFYSFKKLQ